MTLDNAQDDYRNAPSRQTADDYFGAALTCWLDGKIDDATLAQIMRETSNHE